MMPAADAIKIIADPCRSTPVSPYVFGHNLEHTRGAVCGGLSAQMERSLSPPAKAVRGKDEMIRRAARSRAVILNLFILSPFITFSNRGGAFRLRASAIGH